MSNIPEIRIKFAYLLYFEESKSLAGKSKLHSYDQYEKWTDSYRKAWRVHEKTILSSLQNVLGVRFYKSVIDVSCAPFFVPKSDPLIMNFSRQPDQFVDVLMHELCHVILTDNNVCRLSDDNPAMNLVDIWQKLFGKDHDFGTLVHIPVHALSKYIYLDILEEPSRLMRDLKSVKQFQGSQSYVDAWAFVNDHDYKAIVDDLKKTYEVSA